MRRTLSRRKTFRSHVPPQRCGTSSRHVSIQFRSRVTPISHAPGMGGKGRSARSSGGLRRVRPNSRAAKADASPMFLQVEFTGLAPGANEFRAALAKALDEAYGAVGAARFSPEIVHVGPDPASAALIGVLRMPGDQHRSVWAALTLLGEFRGAPARFLVTQCTAEPAEIEIDGLELAVEVAA